jgi:hypothetical protein
MVMTMEHGRKQKGLSKQTLLRIHWFILLSGLVGVFLHIYLAESGSRYGLTIAIIIILTSALGITLNMYQKDDDKYEK